MHKPTSVIIRRIAAFLIDDALVIAFNVGTWFLLTTSAPKDQTTGGGVIIGDNRRGFYQGDDTEQTIWLVLIAVSIALVFWLLPALTGKSPGKAIMGIRVVRADGANPGLWRGFLRFLFLGLIDLSVVGPVVAAVTEHNQRLGDLVAATVAVRWRFREVTS